MARLLDHRLQLLAGMKGDDPAGAYWYFLAGLGITSGALRLVAQLEVAEPGELYALAAFERAADLLEKRLDHVLGLALVQPDLFEQQVGQLGLRQRHHAAPLISLLCTETCGKFAAQQGDQRIAGSVCLRIRKGSFSMLHNYPERKAFPVRGDALATEQAEQAYGPHNGGFLGLQGVQNRLDRGLQGEKHRDVAQHNRLVGRDRQNRQRDRLDRLGIQLKQDRRLWQLVLLQPLRMQLA